MSPELIKTLTFTVWLLAVGLAAMAIGTTSVQTWVVFACLAIVPPVVVRHFWRVREQTLSESISEARR